MRGDYAAPVLRCGGRAEWRILVGDLRRPVSVCAIAVAASSRAAEYYVAGPLPIGRYRGPGLVRGWEQTARVAERSDPGIPISTGVEWPAAGARAIRAEERGAGARCAR